VIPNSHAELHRAVVAVVRGAQRPLAGVDRRTVWQEHWSDMQFARFILSLIGIVLVERAYVRSGG
jgi:hypothetical protein